jgi:hypothetical protein
MPSDKQIQASRTNGARSKGPVTPQGKANSSRNSSHHDLLASTVVLEEECTPRFLDLLTGYMDEFQPTAASQISLVQTMAVARWRLLRVWGAQKTAMDQNMAMQDHSLGTASDRIFVALSGSPDTCSPELLLRYEIAYDRQFSRALVRLLDLQSRPAPSPPAPYHPVAPPDDTFKEGEEDEHEEEPHEEEPEVEKENPLRNEPSKSLIRQASAKPESPGLRTAPVTTSPSRSGNRPRFVPNLRAVHPVSDRQTRWPTGGSRARALLY